jgi:hypothetical protein
VIEFSATSASFLFDELTFSLLDEFLGVLLCFVSRVSSSCGFRANWPELRVRMFASEKFHFFRRLVLPLTGLGRSRFDRVRLTSTEVFLRFDLSGVSAIQIVLLVLDFSGYFEHGFHVRISSVQKDVGDDRSDGDAELVHSIFVGDFCPLSQLEDSVIELANGLEAFHRYD